MISTRWKYADEFIANNISGAVVPFGDDEAFVNKVIDVIENPDYLLRLTSGAKKQAKIFSIENAWNIIKNNL